MAKNNQMKCQLRPSRLLAGFLLLVHAGAIICVSIIPMLWWGTLMAMAVVIISLVVSFRRYVSMRDKRSIILLEHTKNNQWLLHARDGHIYQGSLQGDSLVTTFLVILNFKVEGKRFITSVVILSDTIGPSDFRRLRSYLLARRS